MVWDFVEACPLTDTSGGFNQAVEWTAEVCEHPLYATNYAPAPAVLRRSAAEPQATAAPGARPPVIASDKTPERTAEPQATAKPGQRTLRDDSAGVPAAVRAPAGAAAAIEPQAHGAEDPGFDLICTDPPYYDAIPYSDLMDFFHVWLRRALWGLSPEIDAAFERPLGPKWNAAANDGELIDDAARFGDDRGASKRNYEDGMARALSRFHAALRDDGRLVIVFANKSPDAWETLVSALIRAGFVVVGSWPIQTERLARTRAMQSAALASSIWIVCRKRPAARAGWDAAVLAEMRKNITRQLRDFWVAGILGPDFVWAATGPALEAFSKHPVVKKADAPGERLAVSEFLREVRRFVVDFVVGRVLTHDGDTQVTSGLDDVTTYYLLHRNDFGMGDAPAGACILYAISCNLSDRELTDRYDVLSRGRRPSGGEAGPDDADLDENAGPADDPGSTDSAGSTDGPGGAGSRVALKPWSRRAAKSLGHPAPDGRPPPLIDQAHRLMHLWRAGEEARVNDYLDDRGLKRHALFARLLQALIELADAGSEERAILESLSRTTSPPVVGRRRRASPSCNDSERSHDHLAAPRRLQELPRRDTRRGVVHRDRRSERERQEQYPRRLPVPARHRSRLHPRGNRRGEIRPRGSTGVGADPGSNNGDRRLRATRGHPRRGAALLRRRPKGLLPAARQELLDPSKAWWGGRRGRLADRPRYFISVSLGVVPLVLPRRGSPSTHRGRGWLRSTRSFRTASAPTKLATRRIRTRAWMKQRYWVAPACTSELHHGRGPGTARPFDDAGGDGTQAPPCRRTRPRG